ncbi:glycosyltransferase family 4 protein [Candidatus Uhrbacteria bacterium]|nr:glycosyltransferase family 4 protein [Candidatus Uhrbacteria bacterium]
MRIGIDGRALQDKPWSGVGQYTYNLLHALFGLDKENEYIIWYNAAGALEVPNFHEYPNVRIYRTNWPNKLLNLLMKFIPSVKCCVLRVTFDIFFMPNLNFIALPARTKLILTVHDLSFEHFPEHFSKHTRLVHKAVNPRALIKRASKVIAVSEHTKDDLIETYGIQLEKISVVYPGVHRMQNVKLKMQNERPYILYFGALEPRKNILGIIEAYERLKPRESLMLAGLSTPHVKQLKKRIAQSKLRDKIILVENPNEAEKAAIYAAATLFAYPSFYEGFGFPPLEAMSYGVPVVASSASAVPEICGKAALLVSPWKVEEIEEGMRILLEEDEAREKYIVAGFERIKYFSWEKSAQQTLEIFKSL